MIKLLLILFVYIIGFLISLSMLHKYKKELGLDTYDPPHSPFYDDYTSNASAYLVFSFVWPMFWFIMFWKGVWGLLVKFSKKIGDSNETR